MRPTYLNPASLSRNSCWSSCPCYAHDDLPYNAPVVEWSLVSLASYAHSTASGSRAITIDYHPTSPHHHPRPQDPTTRYLANTAPSAINAYDRESITSWVCQLSRIPPLPRLNPSKAPSYTSQPAATAPINAPTATTASRASSHNKPLPPERTSKYARTTTTHPFADGHVSAVDTTSGKYLEVDHISVVAS